MNHNGIFSLSFPETKTIIVSGDIHETLICWCSNYVSNIRCSTLWSSVKYIDLYHFGYNIDTIDRIIPDRI